MAFVGHAEVVVVVKMKMAYFAGAAGSDWVGSGTAVFSSVEASFSSTAKLPDTIPEVLCIVE